MFARITLKLFCSASVLLFALAVVGCGKGGNSDGKVTVSGKVTQGGQPVAGTVTFIDSANKEYGSPITDGKYQVIGLPVGQAKITVKGAPKLAPPPGGKEAGAMPMGGGAGGVAPNPQYATVAGGLTYDVKAGDQTYDIDLK